MLYKENKNLRQVLLIRYYHSNISLLINKNFVYLSYQKKHRRKKLRKNMNWKMSAISYWHFLKNYSNNITFFKIRWMAKILLHRPTGHCIKIPGNTSSCIFSFALLFPFQNLIIYWNTVDIQTLNTPIVKWKHIPA